MFPRRQAATALTPLLLLALLGIVLVLGAHLLGQHTEAGRAMDLAAQQALRDPRWPTRRVLLVILGLVSPFALAGSLAVLVAVALRQGRSWTAAAITVLMGGANVSTQLLKRVVLERPELGEGVGNTLPSGHATALLSLGLALMLLLPGRRRIMALATFLGTAGALITLWSGAHRPVDPIAAIGVCALWAAVAVPIAARDRCPRAGRPAPTLAARLGWAGVIVAALIPAAIVLARVLARRPPGTGYAVTVILLVATLVLVTVALTARAARAGSVVGAAD
ncbi:MAG: hypothetical protein IPL37_09405 [Austwickia sp.]|nr:hypothetical protein [Austwickia sp.]